MSDKSKKAGGSDWVFKFRCDRASFLFSCVLNYDLNIP